MSAFVPNKGPEVKRTAGAGAYRRRPWMAKKERRAGLSITVGALAEFIASDELDDEDQIRDTPWIVVLGTP